jgi:hypothetical protein
MEVISASLTKRKNSVSNIKANTTSFFEKAKSLFPLAKCAEAATERAWENYITNRMAAEQRFHGAKEKRSKSASDKKEGIRGEDDEELLEEYEFSYINALDLVRRNMAILEKEKELDEGVLSKSFRLLSCHAVFEDEDQVISIVHHTYLYYR